MRMPVALREPLFRLRALRRLLFVVTVLGGAAAGSAQTVNTYYVPWNPADATQNIQSTIDSAVSPSLIILTNQATPWYTSVPIQLSKSNMQIWFADGAKVMAKAGGFQGTADPLFNVTGDSVKINGYANGVDPSNGVATLEMRKTDYMAAPYAKGESRHCINVRGAANTVIQGLNLVRSGGDGITLNPKASNQHIPATNTTITDVTCDDNYRQGISVISADTVTATNCIFKNTGLTGATAPTAGLDIEPSRAYDSLKAVKFVGCTFSGNGSNDVEINLHALVEGMAPAVDVRFEDCVISGGAKNGMAFYGLSSTTGATGTLLVKNTTITATALSGIIFSGWSADRIGITMSHVSLVNCSRGGPPPLLWTQTPNTVQHGDVVFEDRCLIHEDYTRTTALVYVGGLVQSGYGLKDVTGTIVYQRPANSTAPVMTLGSNTVNCTLTLTSKFAPVLTWPAPAAVTYGTPLTAEQLQATADVAGTFTYVPPVGTILNAGPNQPLSASFQPADALNYSTGSISTTLSVDPAPVAITLDGLEAIYDGTPKTAMVITSPEAAVQVTFAGLEHPPVAAGSYPFTVRVTDPNYTGEGSGVLVIGKANPVAAWAAPAPIGYGTALSGAQLNATADVPGTFGYSPPAGTILAAGAGQVLHATFTPADEDNYNAASIETTLTVDPAPAAIVLAGLAQGYDGTPKVVTAATTPEQLPVGITYDGSLAPPTNPGRYAVVATIADPNYSGSASGTLVITTLVLVRHAPGLNGGLDGSLQVLTPENIALSGNAWVAGDLLVPGTPVLRLTGHSTIGGTEDGSGVVMPSDYQVTLSGNAVLRRLVRRIDPVALPVVDAPAPPPGTRTVALSSGAQDAGDFATILNLALSGNAGSIAVPPGAYGNLTASGHTGFVFGVENATRPAVYELQSLALSGSSDLQVVGPVVVTIARGASFSGEAGAPLHSEWLTLRLVTGGLTLSGATTLHGFIVAPNGAVSLSGNASVAGGVMADRLTISGNAAVTQPVP